MSTNAVTAFWMTNKHGQARSCTKTMWCVALCPPEKKKKLASPLSLSYWLWQAPPPSCLESLALCPWGKWNFFERKVCIFILLIVIRNFKIVNMNTPSSPQCHFYDSLQKKQWYVLNRPTFIFPGVGRHRAVPEGAAGDSGMTLIGQVVILWCAGSEINMLSRIVPEKKIIEQAWWSNVERRGYDLFHPYIFHSQ